jgi:hypothetical protein
MINCIRSQNSKGQFPKLHEQFGVLNQSVKTVDNTQNQCGINCTALELINSWAAIRRRD